MTEATQIKKYAPGRIFLFIDETGDPGLASNESSSKYFQLNIAIAHRESLQHMHKHIAAFRYFKDTGKELKRYTRHRDAKLLAGVFEDLAQKHDILFVSFVLDKEQYTGPYLASIGKKMTNYDPKKFRNFVARKSLEYIFANIISVNTEANNIEIVFDRYLESESDELNLKEYLHGNYNLPTFEKIVQIDSEYSEAVQISDFLGRFVKAHCFGSTHDTGFNIYDFARIFIIENPDLIREKRPDTQ